MPVFGAFRVLVAVEFDNQAPLTTDKVDEVVIDRLLASEFEAAESATSKARPQQLALGPRSARTGGSIRPA